MAIESNIYTWAMLFNENATAIIAAFGVLLGTLLGGGISVLGSYIISNNNFKNQRKLENERFLKEKHEQMFLGFIRYSTYTEKMVNHHVIRLINEFYIENKMMDIDLIKLDDLKEKLLEINKYYQSKAEENFNQFSYIQVIIMSHFPSFRDEFLKLLVIEEKLIKIINKFLEKNEAGLIKTGGDVNEIGVVFKNLCHFCRLLYKKEMTYDRKIRF